MKSAPLLLLSVVGGYAFATIWAGSLYYSARESGHRLYFRAVFYAGFLLAAATLIHIILYTRAPEYQVLLGIVSDITGYENSTIWAGASKVAIPVLSFVLGPFFAATLNIPKLSWLINVPIPGTTIRPFFMWERWLLDRAIQNNDFEKLVARSVYTNLPMLLTLRTGKVYVGWAVRAPNPVQDRRAVRILPLVSGYRREETHEVIFTTDYYDILAKVDSPDIPDLDHLELGDFEVVIPSDQICSAHLFDLEAYEHFYREKPEEQGSENGAQTARKKQEQ